MYIYVKTYNMENQQATYLFSLYIHTKRQNGLINVFSIHLPYCLLVSQPWSIPNLSPDLQTSEKSVVSDRIGRALVKCLYLLS